MSEGKRNIVIVGYPKSGTTWLSRLVAELVKCPLLGNWGFNDVNENLIEGDERQSDFQCYKSHHMYDDLFVAWDLKPHKIIYIARDPRDVVVSGAFFFSSGNRLKAIMDRSLNLSQKEMTNAIINGSGKMNKWLETPWETHVLDYYQKGDVHFLRYEDLIGEPERVCNEISEFIGVKITDKAINGALEKQSFANRRQLALQSDDKRNIKLLRKGESGEWEHKLSRSCRIRIEKELKDTIQELYSNVKS